MTVRKLTVIYILFTLIFYGCQSDDQKNAELIRGLNSTVKFLRDVQTDEWSRKFLRKAESDIGLDSLGSGFDSIQIRIWNGCAYKYKPANYWLMSLILDKKGWNAELSDLFIQNTSSGQRDSLSRKITNRQPRSRWANFITKLFKLKILSLPGIGSIKSDEEKQADVMDGCGITIEIATKKIYRVYDYETPDVYVNNHWEVKNILQILNLIENEFGITYEPPAQNHNKSRTINSDSIEIKEVQIQEIKPKNK